MKSKFFLVQTDVFLSICVVLIINSMQSISVFSATRANAGASTSQARTLKLRVDSSGAIAVTDGDTACEQAMIVIHPRAAAGSYENRLNDFLANSGVKHVARIVDAKAG